MFVYPKIKIKELLKVCLCYCFKPFSVQGLKNRLNKFFPDKEIIFTDSGRSAFKAIIEKFNLRGSEIIFPAYICDIFFDIFRQYNLKPIFIDADIKTAGLKIDEIERKITLETKAIFVCHTYGLAENIDKVVDICRERDILLIEDCAHGFLGKHKEEYLGDFGQAAFFSFPKAMPVFSGGMALWDIKFGAFPIPRKFFKPRFLTEFLKTIEIVSFVYYFFTRRNNFSRNAKKSYSSVSPFWSIKILKYFSCLLNGYEEKLKKRITLGKLLLSKINSAAGNFQIYAADNFSFFTILLPESLASKRDKIIKNLFGKNIFCERIWHNPIISHPEIIERYNVNPDDFPNAISIAKRVINLPLQDYFKEKDIEKIANEFLRVIKEYSR